MWSYCCGPLRLNPIRDLLKDYRIWLKCIPVQGRSSGHWNQLSSLSKWGLLFWYLLGTLTLGSSGQSHTLIAQTPNLKKGAWAWQSLASIGTISRSGQLTFEVCQGGLCRAWIMTFQKKILRSSVDLIDETIYTKVLYMSANICYPLTYYKIHDCNSWKLILIWFFRGVYIYTLCMIDWHKKEIKEHHMYAHNVFNSQFS